MIAPVVTRLLAAHARRDVDALARCYCPGATVWPTGWPAPVTADQWLATVPLLVDSFPDLAFATLRSAVAPDVTMLELRMTGTNRGPLHLNDADRAARGTTARSIPPTGEALQLDGVVIFDLRGDAIAAERHYWRPDATDTSLGRLHP